METIGKSGAFKKLYHVCVIFYIDTVIHNVSHCFYIDMHIQPYFATSNKNSGSVCCCAINI